MDDGFQFENYVISFEKVKKYVEGKYWKEMMLNVEYNLEKFT